MEGTYSIMIDIVLDVAEPVADLVLSSDLVKLIYTADPPVGQDKGSSLQGKCPTDRVSDH